MSSPLEQELLDLDAAEAARGRDAARRAELVQQIAAEQEQAAQAVAERWLLNQVERGLGGMLSSLETTVESLRRNPNQKDIASANRQWDAIRELLELAEVVVRRFPGCKAPSLAKITPPGCRGVKDVGGMLTTTTPRALLFPIVTASDSAQLRAAIFARAAWEWLRANARSLPPELRPIVEAEAPVADVSERLARRAAEQARGRVRDA